MRITVAVTEQITGLPPRVRKSRSANVLVPMTVDIKEIASDDVPVTHRFVPRNVNPDYPSADEIQIRFDGASYLRPGETTFSPANGMVLPAPDSLAVQFRRAHSGDEISAYDAKFVDENDIADWQTEDPNWKDRLRQSAQDFADEHCLLVNGELWVRCPTPAWTRSNSEFGLTSIPSRPIPCLAGERLAPEFGIHIHAAERRSEIEKLYRPISRFDASGPFSVFWRLEAVPGAAIVPQFDDHSFALASAARLVAKEAKRVGNDQVAATWSTLAAAQPTLDDIRDAVASTEDDFKKSSSALQETERCCQRVEAQRESRAVADATPEFTSRTGLRIVSSSPAPSPPANARSTRPRMLCPDEAVRVAGPALVRGEIGISGATMTEGIPENLRQLPRAGRFADLVRGALSRAGTPDIGVVLRRIDPKDPTSTQSIYFGGNPDRDDVSYEAFTAFLSSTEQCKPWLAEIHDPQCQALFEVIPTGIGHAKLRSDLERPEETQWYTPLSNTRPNLNAPSHSANDIPTSNLPDGIRRTFEELASGRASRGVLADLERQTEGPALPNPSRGP